MPVVDAFFVFIAVVVLAHGGWWTLLSLAALPRPGRATTLSPTLPLAVIVPAHNEQQLLGACLKSLSAAAYPRPREIIVVADNCSDHTVAIAEALGATVFERTDPAHRGKGFALDYAVDRLRERPVPPGGVVFVDADTVVSQNFLLEIGAAIERGAAAVQVYYAAARGTTPLGRLRRLAFMLLHWSRPLGNRRLGLGTTLKGNGMAVTWTVAREGLGGHGITEDAAMTLALARRGIKIHFLPGARVNGHMAQDYASARTQDQRWERGRLSLLPEALTTAVCAAARGRIACAASALEVASLPTSLLCLLACAALAAAAFGGGSGWLAIVAASSLAAYVAAGLAAARPGVSDILAMVHAPRFVLHKSMVLLAVATRRFQLEWERTRRD
jgi:hypothetical protein